MNIAEQMKAQIAFNKALPRIQQLLTNNKYAVIPYEDGLMELLINAGFKVEHNRFDNDLCVSFKNKGVWKGR